MLACPISHRKIDENVARVKGFISLVILLSGIWFAPMWIILLIEFAIRSIEGQCSPIALLCKKFVKLMGWTPNYVDAAPRMFATRMGFVMSIVIVLGWVLSLDILIAIVLVMFTIAISLQTFLGYCVGCQIYSILLRLGLIRLPS